jgi:hypothetical protein
LSQRPAARGKKLQGRIQGTDAENWHMIFLTSPDVLIDGRSSIIGIKPVVLTQNLLGNVEQLCFRSGAENPYR